MSLTVSMRRCDGIRTAAAWSAAVAASYHCPSGRGSTSLGLPMQETDRKMMDYFSRAKEVLNTPSVVTVATCLTQLFLVFDDKLLLKRK